MQVTALNLWRSPEVRKCEISDLGSNRRAAYAGLGFIAVVIGYLPVLYKLFAQRKAHVIQLDSRAGSPPIGSTMLAEIDGLARLNALLGE